MPKNISGFIGNCRVTAEYAHSPQCSEEYATCSNGKRLVAVKKDDEYYFRHYMGEWEECKCDCVIFIERKSEPSIRKNVESKHTTPSTHTDLINCEDQTNLLYHSKTSFLNNSIFNLRNFLLFGMGVISTVIVIKRYRS